jgi:putative sigma-54 modulation protein
MRLELRGHHVDVTPALRRCVAEKLSKLERLLNHRALSAQAILSMEKHRHVADITLHASGERLLHGLGEAASWETAITKAIAKISHQVERLKTQQKEKRHNLKAPPLEPGEPAARDGSKAAAGSGPKRARARSPRVVRMARSPVKTMSVEQAAREVEAAGDGVVVFRSENERTICVLYRGADGGLALVETEG